MKGQGCAVFCPMGHWIGIVNRGVEAERSSGKYARVVISREMTKEHPSWDNVSLDDLQLINDYLYRNAAWTYDPNGNSCG